MRRKDLKAIQRILAIGKEYVPALLPAKIPRGEMGDCFDHCVMVAANFPAYRYCEGIALDPRNSRWILHAWITDGVHAYDPTWRAILAGEEAPVPTTYIGVEMDLKAVAAFLLKTKHKSIFVNGWMDPELAEKAITSCAP